MSKAGADSPADTVDLIADSLRNGRKGALRRLFSRAGAPAPVILWSPGRAELQNPLIQRFADLCETLMDDNGRVPASAVDLAGFGPLADWMMRVEPAGEHVRYIHYGKSIADHLGQDMTGRTSAEFESYITEFFDALYRAAAERAEWVYSEHEPPAHVFVRVWRRLIVPLFDDAGREVTGFLAINLPENELRVGLELMVDPVFVLDGEGRAHYANRAAQAMFGFGPDRVNGATLEALTGIALDAGLSPADMYARQAVQDSVQLALRGSIAERLLMTVSAAQHRNHAFYIVVMRLIGA